MIFGTDEAGVRTLYIGESLDLARRATNYRNAKTERTRQRTSRRIQGGGWACHHQHSGRLHAVYAAKDDGTFVDVENVLLYNVGTGPLRMLTNRGITFERSYKVPPSPPYQRLPSLSQGQSRL